MNAHAKVGQMTGKVKFFNRNKGFGFIVPDGGGKDVFFHVSAVQKSGLSGLDEGDWVSFDTEPDKRGKGPKAVNLSLAVAPPVAANVNDEPAPAEKTPKPKARAA